jgi:hypothetical protein
MTYAPDDYALVIGVNDYPEWSSGKKSLKAPNDDAKKFHDWLVHPEGGGLLEDNAHLLQSSNNPLSPLQSNIDGVFKQIREQSDKKKRRRFYFYFSGHGHTPAGSWQRQSLCLPNWSPQSPGAALDVDSYIKASVGCLKFSEAVFLLDCCRVREIAPLGKSSDLECGDPQQEGRHYAILYASDHYKPSFEGKVDHAEGDDDGAAVAKGAGQNPGEKADEEVRSYFTFSLLKILKEETIKLGPLVKRLEVDLPALKKGQIARILSTNDEIVLGPPDRKPPPGELISGGTVRPIKTLTGRRGHLVARELEKAYNLTVEIRSDFKLQSPGENATAPAPGDIVVFRGTTIIGRANGAFSRRLPAGSYRIRIVHGEANEDHELRLAEDTKIAYELPSRRSTAPLASTIGPRDELNAIVAESKWHRGDHPQATQAIFISLHPARAPKDGAEAIAGRLYFQLDGREIIGIGLRDTLIPVSPGARAMIVYDLADGSTICLPVPVARGWDTQIFISIGEQGHPSLSTASVSMRVAGEGFDPSDALIDTYELALADLATGGPCPDAVTLRGLLKGEYQNPLYRLVGAHFLIRELSHSRNRSQEDLSLLDTVIEDLAVLMDRDAADVVALRLARANWSDRAPPPEAEYSLRLTAPLLKPGLDAFVQATARSEGALFPGLNGIAIGLDPNTPWTCWSSRPKSYLLSASYNYESHSINLHLPSAESARLDAVEHMWRNAGFQTTRTFENEMFLLRGERVGPEDDVMRKTSGMLSVPDWLVAYVRESEQQSMRTGLRAKTPAMVQRTGMPADLILTARSLAEWQPTVRGDMINQNIVGGFAGGGNAA